MGYSILSYKIDNNVLIFQYFILLLKMNNQLRNFVRKELSKKFDQKESKKIETKLFELCNILATEYDDNIGELYQKFAYDKVGELLTNPDKKSEILTYTLVKAYPSSVGEVPLDYGVVDYAQFDVSFTYQYHTIEEKYGVQTNQPKAM